MAYLYTNLDSDKSLEYIREGLNSGVLRHGWRKDGIVDHFLLDALSIMWNKYYFGLQELQLFTKKYFQMILAINRITDENHRCFAIQRIVEILLENDFELAKKMMKAVVSNDLHINDLLLKYCMALVKVGEPIDEIISWFDYFDIVNYNEESISMKLQILLMIYKSDWYSKEEKESIKDKIKYYADNGWISTPVQWDEEIFQFYLCFCKNENIDASLKNIAHVYEEEKIRRKINFARRLQSVKQKNICKNYLMS